VRYFEKKKEVISKFKINSNKLLHVHTLIEISFSVGNNNPCREDRKI
jgi:hypothetical protein